MSNRKGKEASNYKHGYYSDNKLKCIDCGKELGENAYIAKSKRCYSCDNKGDRNYNYKGKIKVLCSFCKKELLVLPYKIKMNKNHFCSRKCLGKWHSIHFSGRNSPSFGKKASHGKGSYYKNIYMRSSYEINYAKWLDKKGIKWQYESKVFDLGICTYTPDFYLLETDTYIEIKGWWRDKSKYKFELFKQIYPQERISILTKLELHALGVL